MELDFLQIFLGLGLGFIIGVFAVLLVNKLKTGSASPAAVKSEFDNYKNDVETHFEETSKKFKQMTEQYQDLYEHLSVGATSLCRPGSVAAALAGDSANTARPLRSIENKEAADKPSRSNDESTESKDSGDEQKVASNHPNSKVDKTEASKIHEEPQQKESDSGTDKSKLDKVKTSPMGDSNDRVDRSANSDVKSSGASVDEKSEGASSLEKKPTEQKEKSKKD